MTKQIIRRDYVESYVNELIDLHPLLRRLYAARQVKSTRELERTLEHLIPFDLLKGVDEATTILADAISKNKKILIVGDFDADGATSTAVAIRALKSFGAHHVNFLVPNRFEYGYGLSPELVNIAKDLSPDLIVTVDNGIANNAGVAAAKELGIKVVITDHHLPGTELPLADAIVNPNQPHDEFPSKNLAGVGVIFYVMLALRRQLININWFTEKNIPEPNMAKLLDLVALGTVADLVQLDHNNRILVYQGLRRIRSGQCIPAIVALLELADRDFKQCVAADLGFAVAARLNAAGRMNDMSLGIECLLSDDPAEVRRIAKMLDEMNEERKTVEKDMQTQAIKALQKINSTITELPKGLCLFDESWHQGVIGILASRIKDKFNRPVVVFAPGQAEELKGSARSIAGLHIRDVFAIIAAQYPEIILKFGGHAMAAGLTIPKTAFANFAKVFNEIVSIHLHDDYLKHSILSDGELLPEDFCLEVASMLKNEGPWGQAFPEPMFDNVFRILEQRIVGDKHLKLRLAAEDKIIDAISFFVDTNEWPNHRCETVRAAYRLDINEYKGRRSVQLIIDHLEPQ